MRYATIRCLVMGLGCCVFVSSLNPQSPTGPDALEVTVCQLASNCSQFDQKRVRFKAEFISDGLENSSLVDPTKCSQGIQPWTSKAVDRHPDIEALDAALAKGYRGTSDKQILGTFTGRYECSTAGTKAVRILRIESIEGLTVTPLSPDSPDQNHAQSVDSGADKSTPTDGLLSVGAQRDSLEIQLTVKHNGDEPDRCRRPVRLRSQELLSLAEKQAPISPPAMLHDSKLHGEVRVEVSIDNAGSVTTVRGVEGHPFALLSALESVRVWSFRPYKHNGEARCAIGIITLDYDFRSEARKQ